MELKEGEIICPECEGRRYENEQWDKCGKCHGAGKLDWVEKVCGKKPPKRMGIDKYKEYVKAALGTMI